MIQFDALKMRLVTLDIKHQNQDVSNSNGPVSMIRQIVGVLRYRIMATAIVVLHWSTIFVLKLLTIVWKIRKTVSAQTSQPSQRCASSDDEEASKQQVSSKAVSIEPTKPDPNASMSRPKARRRADTATTRS